MALKDTVRPWYEGVLAYEAGDYISAMECFRNIQEPSARIFFTMAQTEGIQGHKAKAKQVIQI